MKQMVPTSPINAGDLATKFKEKLSTNFVNRGKNYTNLPEEFTESIIEDDQEISPIKKNREPQGNVKFLAHTNSNSN